MVLGGAGGERDEDLDFAELKPGALAVVFDDHLQGVTLVTRGTDEIIEQITKQLHKLIDVVKLMDMTDGPHIEREMMLVKVRAEGDDRHELKRNSDIFRGRIIDVSDETYTVEMTGASDKLDAFLQVLDQELIIEVVRSGVSGIGRGDRSLKL